MAVDRMKFVRVTGPVNRLDSFLSQCCTNGNFQPEKATSYLSASLGFAPLVETNPYAPLLQKLEELADENSSGVKLQLMNKYSKKTSDEKTVEYINELTELFSCLREKRNELLLKLRECESKLEQLKHFTGFDIDLQELFGCQFVDVRFGHLPKENYNKLVAYVDNPYVFFVPCSSDATDRWGVYCAPSNRIKEVDRIFAGLYFERIHIPPAAGTPEQAVDVLENEAFEINSELRKLEDEVVTKWNEQSARCNDLYTKLYTINAVFELRRYAATDGSYFFYVGWIPETYEATLKKKLSAIKGTECELTTPEKEGAAQPPIKLKNPRVFRPYEYFVQMYGLPSYNDVDVTPFMAVTYTVLFGIMFADVGQGLVLFILGMLGWKLKKLALARILVPCGLMSSAFGFVFGSVFGYEEALDPVYHALGMKGKPLSVMDSINTVLLLAIGIGVALVVVAMLLNVYSSLKRRHIGEALFSENGVTGILFYLAAVAFAVAFMGGKRILPNSVLLAVMGVCALLLYLKELLIAAIDHEPERKPDSISDFLLQNVFEVIEYVLSYFSNTVSFLRVGAFVIVHASMMLVVFTLGGNGTNIPVIILGNIVVIALEGLLTGIQGLRLEFYEMFSRFYEGSGKPFTAVKL